MASRRGRQPTSLPVATLAMLKHSQLYSESLGIDLASGREDQYFLWFLASLLFGGRITETIARRTFETFRRYGLTTPRRIIAAGWNFLVNPVMREGGYVRYDGRKSDQVLRDCEVLLVQYGGKLSRLHALARDPLDLEARLLAFHGVGPVTVNIFLRELRPYWSKADPPPLPTVMTLAKRLGGDLSRYQRHSLSFARLEAGLVRLAREERRQQARTSRLRPKGIISGYLVEARVPVR